MAHVRSHPVIPHAIELFENAVSNLFCRLLTAIEQANMRRAERQIERLLGAPGVKFTDEFERKVERFLQGR